MGIMDLIRSLQRTPGPRRRAMAELQTELKQERTKNSEAIILNKQAVAELIQDTLSLLNVKDDDDEDIEE